MSGPHTARIIVVESEIIVIIIRGIKWWTFHLVAFLVLCFQVKFKVRMLVFVGGGKLDD